VKNVRLLLSRSARRLQTEITVSRFYNLSTRYSAATHIGFIAIGNVGNAAFPAIIGQPGSKCLIPQSVKIVIKLPAELVRTVQPAFAVYNQDTETVRERVIGLILHEL